MSFARVVGRRLQIATLIAMVCFAIPQLGLAIEIYKWVDESDWGDFRELAKAVHADTVVHIELDDFQLYKGTTLYQGRADVTVSVYDVQNHNRVAWDRHLGEVLYPTNSGIPAQDKPVQQFEREFVDIIADQIATNFYRHDPNANFAMDATANR